MDLPSKTGQQRTCQSKQSKQHFGMDLPSKTGQQRTCQSKQSENGSYDLARTALCKGAGELPLAGAAASITFVATSVLLRQTRVSCDKTRQNYVAYFCRDKRFVATNIILSRQTFCHDKHTFVTTKKNVFCRDKHMFIVTHTCL